MLKVVKIGGNVVDNPEKLDAFLRDFAVLEGPKILVHGGGKIATTVGKALGIEATMIGGRRVTDAGTLKVVTMVYGVDGGLIVSARRSPEPVDYGFVGDPSPDGFSVKAARTLIDAGYVPVVAPITVNGDGGGLLNTNADTVARTVAVGLSHEYETELVYCFEKPGVLRDVNDERSVIAEITPSAFERLRAEGVVADGMLPKLENAFRAIGGGVKSVVICGADALTRKGYGGTTLRGE